MMKVSLLIVLVGAYLASASLFYQRPRLSSEFKRINDWLVENLPDNKDGYENVRKAAEYYATRKASMKPKEQEAWELFTSLAKLETECTVEAAKVVHRNFDQVELIYPDCLPELRIERVLVDVQKQRLKRCKDQYYALVDANDPWDHDDSLVARFGVHWQRIVYKRNFPEALEFPQAERSQFGEVFEKQGEKIIAKLVYESLYDSGPDGSRDTVKTTIDEKTGKTKPPSQEVVQSFIQLFYDECNSLIEKLGDKVDLMMAKRGYVLAMYRRVEFCKRLKVAYKPEKLAKALIKLSKNNFLLF